MSTSAIGTTFDSIRAGLVALPALSGVNVFSGPVSLEEAGLECIAFGIARLAEEPMAMGGQRMETWTVEGNEIYIRKTWQGSTETTIKAARDRALAVFAAIETHLNDTYVGSFPDVEINAAEMASDFDPEARICRLGFTLTVQTYKNP